MSGHLSSKRGSFEIPKGIAALGYLIEATGESMYSLLKMMYLADKLHLQRYGRFIAGDRYAAMKQGPVPSNAYAIFQHLRGERLEPSFEVAARYFDYRPLEDHKVSLRERPDFDELSTGEIQCLEAIVDTYKKFGKWAVRNMSHDEAWDAAWNSRFLMIGKSVPMETESIARQFDNAKELIAHLKDPFPGEAQAPEGLDTESNDRYSTRFS